MKKKRRNQIAWKFALSEMRRILPEVQRTETGSIDLESAKMREGIEKFANRLGISKEESREFTLLVFETCSCE